MRRSPCRLNDIISKAEAPPPSKEPVMWLRSLGDAVGHFLKPATKDHATMISHTKLPALPKESLHGYLANGIAKAETPTDTQERSWWSFSEARASDCQIWITIQGTAGWNIYFSARTTSEVFSCCRMVVFGACAQDAQKGASDGQRTPAAWVMSTRWVTWRLGPFPGFRFHPVTTWLMTRSRRSSRLCTSVPLHVMVLFAGDHLHGYFSGCNKLQGSCLYAPPCALGD